MQDQDQWIHHKGHKGHKGKAKESFGEKRRLVSEAFAWPAKSERPEHDENL
jgi:hypothetical protein